MSLSSEAKEDKIETAKLPSSDSTVKGYDVQKELDMDRGHKRRMELELSEASDNCFARILEFDHYLPATI